MKTVTPMDLRRSLGSILDEASAGERFLIERDHKPMAVLVSVEDAARLDEDPEEARRRRMAALDAIDEWRERVLAARPPGEVWPDAAEWVRADRDEHTRRDMNRVPKMSRGRVESE
jgi:antitoxin (DNA-binding transcriptional repressor) of toxin-antitoxin stability system